MTDDADESETTPAETEGFTAGNVNGQVLDTATVNAYVVGVTISEGDPQAASVEG